MGCWGRFHSEPVARSHDTRGGRVGQGRQLVHPLGVLQQPRQVLALLGREPNGGLRNAELRRQPLGGQIRGAGDGGRSGLGPNQFRLRGRVQGLAVEPGLADARVIRALRTEIDRVVLGPIAQGRLGVVDHRGAGGGGQVPDTDVRMLWLPGGLARELALQAGRFVGELRADMVDLDLLAGGTMTGSASGSIWPSWPNGCTSLEKYRTISTLLAPGLSSPPACLICSRVANSGAKTSGT